MAVKKTYRINLRNYGSPPAVMVSQYDEGYAIAFEIFDGPLPVLASSLSGYTFKLKGRQPGNPPFLAYEFEGTLATALNAVVSFEIDTTMTGRAGKGTAELVILDEENDVKFASVNFAVYTEPAAVPDGSIDADVQRAMEIAEEVQEIVDTAAAEVKGEAEAWAVGQRDGVDVPSTDPAYENNAKFYAEQAAQIAEDISGVTEQVATNTSDISDLKEDLTINNPPTVTWQIGGFNSDGAINSSNKYAIRNSGGAAISIPVDGTIGCASGYRIKVVKYSSVVMGAGTMLSNSGWVTEPVSVSAGDFVGISLMYGTDTTVELVDTSISTNVVFNLRTVYIPNGLVTKAKLSQAVQTVLDAAEAEIPQIDANEMDITRLKKLAGVTDDMAYVTNGISTTHYGVTYAKTGVNKLSLYGESTGLGYFHVFNGANSYSNSGSSTPSKNLTEGLYVIEFEGNVSNMLEVCYTDSTYNNRVVLTSGQILTVGASGGAIFARIYKSKDFGTSEAPTLLTLSIYKLTYDHGAYNVFSHNFADWYSGLNGDYSTYNFGWGTKYADVLTLFDALVTDYPDYITKTALGTGSGTDGNGNAYTLYEYAFVPKIKKISQNKKHTPKILLDGSIHGFEKNSTFGLYCFLRDVCKNWEQNPTLEYIRHFVEIRVVPVSNPWGFDNNDRRNYNGVNLNRNFPCAGWEAGEESGDAPLDQPESAILAAWIKANADMLYYLNLHTNGQYNADGWTEANYCMSSSDRNDDYFNRIFGVFSKHITEQTYKFADMYDIDFGSGFFGIQHTEATATSGKGTVQIYCHTYLGYIMAMTLESFNGVSINGESVITVLSPQSTKMCSEIIGNMVIQILEEYAE